MKIDQIEMFTLDLPFASPRTERHMHRASTHGERVCVFRVRMDTGVIGYGEMHGQGADSQDLVARNPFELLWDDSINPAVQIAILDAVGRQENVPVYRLIGSKVRDWCPISWWAIDMPPEDWAQEAEEAQRLGYTSFKLKARPWFDIIQQVDAIAKVVPESFKLDVDFNGFLLNAGNALPVLKELEKRENVAIFESPIPQTDVEGYRQIRSQISHPISLHFGTPPIMTALKEEVCDGFVISGSAGNVIRQGTIAAVSNKSFWLQMVGSGIMTAFTVHLGAVLSHARWPAITCHELFEDDLLKERLEVKDGYIRCPEAPGLGVEIDQDALEKYRVDDGAPTPQDEYLKKRRVLRICWPPRSRREEARTWAFTRESDYQQAFYAGNLPLFVPGVTLEVIENDGSQEFNRIYSQVEWGEVR